MRHNIGVLMMASSPLIVIGLIGYTMYNDAEPIPFGDCIAPAWFMLGTLLLDPARCASAANDCDETADEPT